MPLEREIWEETVQEKLLEDNSRLQAVSDVEDSSIL